MIDISIIKDHILRYKSISYNESHISKVIKKIEKYKTLPICDENVKIEYFLAVIEGIVACKSLYLAQNAGCFRYSIFKAELIFELARFLLVLRKDLGLSDSDVQFLDGIHHFKKIHDAELKLTEKLKNELIQATKLCNIHGKQCSYIMTLCTYVEHLIVAQKSQIKRDKMQIKFDYSALQRDEHKKELLDYSIEEIISALSFIISIYNEIPHMQKLPNCVFAKHVATKRSQKILFLACKIRFLQELQQANEQFGYACCMKKGELYLQTTTANTLLLQDYRVGHIKRALSNMNFMVDMLDQEKISFLEIVDHMICRCQIFRRCGCLQKGMLFLEVNRWCASDWRFCLLN